MPRRIRDGKHNLQDVVLYAQNNHDDEWCAGIIAVADSHDQNWLKDTYKVTGFDAGSKLKLLTNFL